MGLVTIYETMTRLHDQHGEWLKPAPLLEQLAKEGKRFSDLDMLTLNFPWGPSTAGRGTGAIRTGTA